jgi:adenosylcobinamide-phosphate synthase
LPTGGAIAVLVMAAGLDFLLGDPWHWPHPVQAMGGVIHLYTGRVFKLPLREMGQRLAGIGLAGLLILGSGGLGALMVWGLAIIHPLLGMIGQTILLASCFAGRSLRAAAADVLLPLQAGDLERARNQLSRYVGRDTADLSEPEILRAILETVTENATDGVMAPLFYAGVGLLLPMVGAVPLALAYKAASTLDSMVGYRESPYTYLGWFPARLEDVLTWLPCRLTVLTVGCLVGHPLKVWRCCQQDATKDPSPNAGWSECAYAVALGVQLGGMNTYRGISKPKPLLGEPIFDLIPAKIDQALNLTRAAFLLWLSISVLIGCGLVRWGYSVAPG